MFLFKKIAYMKKTLVAVFCLIVQCTSVSALERFEIITSEELRDLLGRREKGKIDFVLVNALDQLIADHHSIPGSINIPWSEFASNSSRLGPNKDRLVISYCMGYR